MKYPVIYKYETCTQKFNDLVLYEFCIFVLRELNIFVY
jgi:hypothetical protein